MTEQTTTDLTLQDAISRYVRTLGDGKPEVAAEVTRFGRWFGANRPMRNIQPADIERFGEETSKNPVDARGRLQAVREFLAYANKTKLTNGNLATHLRLRRTGTSDPTTDATNSDRIEVSAEGLNAIQTELTLLVSRRPEIADELRLAMADKDFRENAPLDAAREKQAHLEARIRELEATVKRAVVVEAGHDSGGRARMGSRVTLRTLQTDEVITYMLVGPGEVDAAQKRISVQSPVGRAVLNCTPGDEVEVSAPAGKRRYRVEAVES